MIDIAAHDLLKGEEYPYDTQRPEGFQADWAVRAARGVLIDLQGRKGMLAPLEDAYVRHDIVDAFAAIIRAANADENARILEIQHSLKPSVENWTAGDVVRYVGAPTKCFTFGEEYEVKRGTRNGEIILVDDTRSDHHFSGDIAAIFTWIRHQP